jgi:uncharacterized delta-60 repeat protein
MNYLNRFRGFSYKSVLFSLLIFTFIIFTFIYAFSSPVYAAPGDLDRSFGVGGIVKTPFMEANSIDASTIQPDGKVIVVGSIRQPDFNRDFYVLRFNGNGSFDTTFGVNGKLIIVISNRDERASGVTLQADGKIIVVGTSRDSSANYNFATARLNQNGTLDTTFNTNGFAIAPSGSVSDFGTDAIVQSDNKIILCGQSPNFSNTTFTVVRYNTNGSLDTSFDGDGISKIQFSPSLNSSARSVKLQTDGKIVVAGVSSIVNFDTSGFGIARLDSNGTPDTSFGNNGTVIIDVSLGSAHQSIANELLIQPDGKIVAVGTSNSGFTTSSDFAVVRLNFDGSLDNSFGNNGKVITPIQGYNDDQAREVILQPDGKLIVGGIGKVANDTDFAIIRYNSNGTLDTIFGNKGVALSRIPGSFEGVSNLKVEADGKIFAAGLATFSGVSNYELTLARYLINGSREADFDGDKKSDISVFRPATGVWYLQQSTDGFAGVTFGQNGDMITSADYDGDGKTDVAVYRAGIWYLQRSSLGFAGITFGAADDIPIPADYDGDGKADIALFRPSNGTWYLLQSTAGFVGIAFGQVGDKPVAADYDGDGKTDVAVFRAGIWYIQRSQLGFTGIAFGESTDKPVVGDYDGDGKADVAVFRPSNGVWYLLRSQLGFTGIQFGLGTDVPVPADYDGDGRTDVAVFRDGVWYLNRSTAGFTGVAFGTATDKPVPNAFIP